MYDADPDFLRQIADSDLSCRSFSGELSESADAWDLAIAQAKINADTLKAFQEAAHERESALHRELALARAGR
jgi:hypothetical protein